MIQQPRLKDVKKRYSHHTAPCLFQGGKTKTFYVRIPEKTLAKPWGRQVHEGISREKGVVDVADTTKKRVRKKTADDEIKTSLMNRYREMFIDKLTPQDLEELQLYRKKQYDKERGWNNEYKQKFESKLRQFFHEEVLRREIASIETLLGLMQRQDLRS